MICPNKSSKEWQAYVSRCTSMFEAYRGWIANNFSIPANRQSQVDILGRYSLVIRNNVDQITKLGEQRKDLYRRLKKTEDLHDQAKIRLEINNINDKIESLKSQNKDINNLSNFADIVVIGEGQLAEIDNILNSPTVDIAALSRHSLTISMWKKISDVTTKEHPSFTDEELTAIQSGQHAAFAKAMATLNGKARLLDTKMVKLAEKLIVEKILESNLDMTAKEAFAKAAQRMFKEGAKDPNWITAMLYDISDYDNALFTMLVEWVREADFRADQEFLALTKKIQEFLQFSNEEKELFKQVFNNSDSRQSGNFTTQFTYEYFTNLGKIFGDLHNDSEIGYTDNPDVKLSAAYKKFINELSKVAHVIDVNKLFDSEIEGTKVSEKEREEYITYLKNLLGEKQFQHYYDQAKASVDAYKISRDTQYELYKSSNPDHASYMIRRWIMRFSPFWAAKQINEGYTEWEGIGPRTEFAFTHFVPKNTEGYDNKYKQIEADPKLFEKYQMVKEIMAELNSYIPASELKHIYENFFPNMEKTMMKTLIEGGILKGAGNIWANIQKAIRTQDLGKDVKDLQQEITGERSYKYQFPLIADFNEELANYVSFKAGQYQNAKRVWISQGKTTDERAARKKQVAKEIEELIPSWRTDKLNELSQAKDWNIPDVLAAYGAMALTYKYRSGVEDSIQLIDMIMKHVQEIIANPAGINMTEPDGTIANKSGLTNQMDSYRHFKDIFFGYPSRAVEGQTTTKILTAEERKTMDEYEAELANIEKMHDDGTIKDEEFADKSAKILELMDALGGYATASSIGDTLLTYMQLRGIGWNVFSATSNMTFGMVTNLIEAADGRRFKLKHYINALGLVLNHSVLRSTGLYETETGRKIHNLMKKYNLPDELRYEITGTPKSKLKENASIIMPYEMQKRTEFINQATTMIAMMMKKQVTVDGKKMSMWDAYDAEGKINYTSEIDEEVNFTTLVHKTIRTLHGNYDNIHNAMKAKKTFFGRSLLMFRTWAMAGFYERFAAEDPMTYMGYRQEGRYRAYGKFYKQLGAVRGTFELTKQLLRKMAMSTEFDMYYRRKDTQAVEILTEEEYNNLTPNQRKNLEKLFDETDAANLRKNLQEIVVALALSAIGLGLKAVLLGDKDDEEKMGLMFTINQISRLQTDIFFYVSPTEFEKLNRQAMPLFSTISDAEKLLNHAWSLMWGGEDTYTSGIYAGQSKTYRYSTNLIPFLVTINRMEALVQSQVWK